MTASEMWNKIVTSYKKNLNAKEEIIQTSWELLFSTIFGYDDDDIDSQRSIKLGATARGDPDIIIKKNGADIFVVELKRYTIHDGREQLFSYLNQLKMNLGIVVCDTLSLYDYDYTKKESAYSELEIAFTSDNPDGIAFMELFCKDTFDSQKVKDFISSKNRKKNNYSHIKNSISESLIINLLEEHFVKQYPKEDVDEVLSSISITIGDQMISQDLQSPTISRRTYEIIAPEVQRDGKTTVTIKGVTLPLSRSSDQTVQDFVKQTLTTLFTNKLLPVEEIIRMQDLKYSQNAFGIQHPLLEKDSQKIVDGAGHLRYWSSFRAGGFYVCSQWWKGLFSSYESKIAEWLIGLEKSIGN